MRALSCRKLGNDCNFVSYGFTVAEIKIGIIEHTKEAHPIKYKDMTKKDLKHLYLDINQILSDM